MHGSDEANDEPTVDPNTPASSSRGDSLHSEMMEIILDLDADFTEKCERVLQLGCCHLDLPIGILFKNLETTQVVIKVHDPDDLTNLQMGDVLPLDQTYCKELFRTDQNFYCTAHAGEEGWGEDPAYNQFGLETYIGKAIYVQKTLYGTFCFGSPGPTPRVTSDQDRETMDLLAQWLEYELARGDTERQLQRFFNLSVDFLCIAHCNGFFEHVNPALCEALGYEEETLLGKPFLEFVHPEDRGKTTEAVRRLNEGKKITEFEHRYKASDGSYRWISWRAVPSGFRNRFYAVGRDRTERKQVERMKDEVISIVSHELRTPLTSIKGALDLGFELYEDEIDKDLGEFIEIALESTQRLERLVNDILALEKLQAEQLDLQLQSFRPASTVREVAKQLSYSTESKDVELETEIDAPDACVEADPDRLHQVLTNLTSNAIKFSPENSTVSLQLFQPQHEEIEIRVVDEGPGIPATFHNEIYNRFTQADVSNSRKNQGSGLGLAIGKSLIDKMNGEIDYQTTPGEGTTFMVRLPTVED